MCALRPHGDVQLGFCLLMADIEPLKPSNTGWLVADMVPHTFAFSWARTETDRALLALLADPAWQPYVVFPGEFVAPHRVVHALASEDAASSLGKRPLFILLDGTWAQARKMFRKSPYLDAFPVLSLAPPQMTPYQLRRSGRDDHFCTSEVAALCLALAGEVHTAQTLQAYLGVYTHRYLRAKHQLPVDPQDAAHARLLALAGGAR